MIGTVPMRALAPIDYRYALDAARTHFAPGSTPIVRCAIPELAAEAAQRFPHPANPDQIAGAVWIEPLLTTWRAELTNLAPKLPVGGSLAVIASQPLARIIPERRAWSGQPLGVQLMGWTKFRQALRTMGFVLDATYGFHSATSILLSQLSHVAARLGRPDVADRLHFAARLRYCVQHPRINLTTVGLLVARKEQA